MKKLLVKERSFSKTKVFLTKEVLIPIFIKINYFTK